MDSGPRTTVCSHCGASLGEAAETPAFCCRGCATAFALLAGCGLGDHARLRQQAVAGGAAPRPVAAVEGDWSTWAEPAFRLRHEVPLGPGRHAFTWAVEGMHCPACVWVLERLPFLLPGIHGARVDVSRARLTVVFDPAAVSPADQAAVVARLGYRLRPVVDQDAGTRRTRLRGLALRFAVAFAGAIGSMQLAMNLLAGEFTGDLDPAGRLWFGILALVLALPAGLWATTGWWRALAVALRHGRWSLDATAALVVAMGLGTSVASLVRGQGPFYADAVAMFAALLLGGRLILAQTQDRIAADQSRLGGLLPEDATRVERDPSGEVLRRVPVAELLADEVIHLRPGERLPGDGVVLAAESGAWLDQAVMTGESRGVPATVGHPAFAGTVAGGGWLRLRLQAVGADTRLRRLVTAAEADALRRSAAGVEGGWERWYGLALVLASVAAVPLSRLAGVPWDEAFARGLAVLMAACPCAIGLALPLCRAQALGAAAAAGILVRDAATFSRLGSITRVVLDKTGTLTRGRPTVAQWTWLVAEGERAGHAGRIVASEARARHPAALAIAGHLADLMGKTPGAAGGDRADSVAAGVVEELAGQGLRAEFADGVLRLGSSAFSGVAEAVDGRIGVSWTPRAGQLQAVAWLQVDDGLRSDAPALVADLRRRGLALVIASGDDAAPVAACATALGISEQHARCSPEAKAALVQDEARERTLMVGDGINDAPALAAAQVGVAVRGGLAAGLACADAVVADDQAPLAALSRLLTGAARVRARERRLLAATVLYNGVVVTGAALGWFGPLICAIGMPLSSAVSVILAGWGRDFPEPRGSS